MQDNTCEDAHSVSDQIGERPLDMNLNTSKSEELAAGTTPTEIDTSLQNLVKDSWLSITPPLHIEEDLTKMMLNKLHQYILEHLITFKMPKTAEAFSEESLFFPIFKATDFANCYIDVLVHSFSSYMLQAQTKEMCTPVGITRQPDMIPTSMDMKSKPQPTIQPRTVDTNGKDKTIFSCRESGCNTCCTTLANMKRHERLHYGEKPFDCISPGCGKVFARKYDLKVHTRIHTKEKPYECEYQNCGKTFSRISGLGEHQKIVHKRERKSTPKVNRAPVPVLKTWSPEK